ncbi:hypothetical protein NQ314_008615 [Rhamnusium bicolor]|uniref:Phospholipid scramblase n=1 Tax=Rhamnusium bicolor TaxID=1586634 RepID=A0AAV8Y939_9CUCU|nr:hypothetical protein NQ314_008615 [Rhamnusium bicolor]
MSAPITNQPKRSGGTQTSDWMDMPKSPPNCPAGLEYLTMIDQLYLYQKVDVLETLIGLDAKFAFTVKNSTGEKIYNIKENSFWLTRCLCGQNRPFDINIIDKYRNKVIHLHKPFSTYINRMKVSAPPGTEIGTVDEEGFFFPSYIIKNATGSTTFRIESPLQSRICSEATFPIKSGDGSLQVGEIYKYWWGCLGAVREILTDADYFRITFPMDLDIKMKAVMLGACILINSSIGKSSNAPGQ